MNSDNQKTYIHGYMESIGYGEIDIKDVPILNNDGIILLKVNIFSSLHLQVHGRRKRNWGIKSLLNYQIC